MILIVDDKAENILPLKRILELNNYKTDSANSGELALKKVLKNVYSLIILDVQMPMMDGFEVAEAISSYSKSKDTPIIFLSAVNKEKEFITKGYLAGGVDYIVKPVDPDILLHKVRNFIKLFDHQQHLKRVQADLLHEIEIRKQAEENLRTVLASLPQIAFTLNSAGLVEYVNQHWHSYAPDASTFPETPPGERDVQQTLQLAVASGKEFKCELRLKELSNNTYNYFLLKIIPVFQDNAVIRWVGTFSDIQQQKQANELLEEMVAQRTEELLRKNTELETTNHELQQFSWVVSHDLKEPLRKIQTFNHLVKEKFLNGNREAVTLLNRSIDSAARLSTLIGDLLNFSRLSASAHFIKTDLQLLVDEVISEYEDVINEKSAMVTVGKLPMLEAAPSQLRLVFQNLLSNSLKFSRKGTSPVISIDAERVAEKKVNAESLARGPFCRIIFKDNGIGFKEEYLSKIFIIFQQLNTDKEYEGTGIGLAIANKVIEKHNGLITARSQENVGTSFIIILPMKQYT